MTRHALAGIFRKYIENELMIPRQARDERITAALPASADPLVVGVDPLVVGVDPLVVSLSNHERAEVSPSSPSIKESRMKELIASYEGCIKCALSKERKTIVCGTGDLDARLMIIGEAPGADEDEQGVPFVGRSGQLLTKMLAAIEIDRKNVFITNIVKCRPPANRNPEKIEIESCHPFLTGQIEIIAPELIVTLGSFAARTILAIDDKIKISKFRGQIYLYQGIKCMPTFHPAYLLRNQSAKKEAMVDLKKIKEILDIEPGIERRL